MPAYLPPALLLFLCWIAASAVLLIFLESWFSVSGRERFIARRASGAYGICSVFLPLHGAPDKIEKTIRSVLGQSYPFIELFLLYPESDWKNNSLAQEFRSVCSHVPVRLIPVAGEVETPHDRIRALEQAQPVAKGRWYVLLEPSVVLDRFAIEASMEFAGSGEVSALALRPGTQCASMIQKLLAPAVEYVFQMLRIVERRRERARKVNLDSSYLLINRESFEVVKRINRMPGILNEAGWSIWSYQIEGFRTFEGDGSRWVWREIGFGSWWDRPESERRYSPRTAGLVAVATAASLIPVGGLIYGFSGPIVSVLDATILALSAASYALMSISYYLYARRLHASTWFAPFWFIVQPAASVLAFLHIRRARFKRDHSRAGRLDSSAIEEGWTRRTK